MYTSFLKNIKGDKVIWGVVIFLFLFSFLVIYSSTSALAAARGTTTTAYLIKQFIYVFIAFVVMYLMHIIPIGWYRRFAALFFVAGGLLILVTLAFGKTLNDSTRWLYLPFGLTFQPADIARIGVILFTAKIMESYDLSSFRDFVKKLLLPVSIIFLLIIWSSTSTALLLAFTLAVLLFIGGIKTAHLLKTAGILVVALAFVVLIGKTTHWFPRVETAVNRVETFFAGNNNGGDNLQKIQSKVAIAKGGIIGVGPGRSTQRLILPHPYSDFIYAIIIEEYGIVGGLSVILLYLILLFRAIVIARSCTRVFSMVLVLGLVFMITLQAIVNMGVAVGIFPITGQPLPLLSQGGSSLITFCIALGMVLAVSRATEERDIKPAG
ncbi:MAG: FtsW/RodA/SpoVE family cell cycle protein [Bacteroidales bacterium]|nr:FtsW/RodA/SpoVE family cell cycle protein [Bacteroidales bacterium]MCL2133233.1 FtsW/RodA/SpoVE family cell cycle protein [Bacteroidales bacterium]